MPEESPRVEMGPCTEPARSTSRAQPPPRPATSPSVDGIRGRCQAPRGRGACPQHSYCGRESRHAWVVGWWRRRSGGVGHWGHAHELCDAGLRNFGVVGVNSRVVQEDRGSVFHFSRSLLTLVTEASWTPIISISARSAGRAEPGGYGWRVARCHSGPWASNEPQITKCHSRQVYPQVYPHTQTLKKSLQNMYTRIVLCGILSSNALASVGGGVCRILRTILENY